MDEGFSGNEGERIIPNRKRTALGMERRRFKRERGMIKSTGV